MAQDDEPSGKRITVDAEQYRSHVLGRLRAEIASRQAAMNQVEQMAPEEIANFGYYKMKYYKMPYWKLGHIQVEAPFKSAPDAEPDGSDPAD